MSSFNESKWADGTFVQEYQDGADHYIPERAYLFHVLRSYCRYFHRREGRTFRICDLGCGDGILTWQLLNECGPVSATLVDGSADMLASARRRFTGWDEVQFVQKTFDEFILAHDGLGPFDLVLSGFAIHHVHRDQRRQLFRAIHQLLAQAGHFLNVETALPAASVYTEWYFELWREWIEAHGRLSGENDRYLTVPDQARANPDNKYSPLQDQLADLREAGFLDVECHYRNGIFTVYGGIKRDGGRIE